MIAYHMIFKTLIFNNRLQLHKNTFSMLQKMSTLGISSTIETGIDEELVIGVTDTLTVRAAQIRAEVSSCGFHGLFFMNHNTIY